VISLKVASIVGARPNFVKLAPISKELRKEFEEIIIHTGQHYDYDMNKIFFDELGIPEPNYHLNVGSGAQGVQTAKMMVRIENILLTEKPDFVLAFGDTNSTLAGALAAVKMHIKIGHIEAGLRSYNKKMPEEINRILTDHCSDLLFCPTKTAVKNLDKEGITNGVYFTGDVMVDALSDFIEFAENNTDILNQLELNAKEYYLATIHRAENTDDKVRLEQIVDALCQIQNVVFPCHPRTEKYLKQYGLWRKLIKHVRVIEPLGYLDMLMIVKNANKILTDSGGVQKEAYILKVPCITLREETEWVETVDDGWNVLVGADKGLIVENAMEFNPSSKSQSGVFGYENTSENIVKILLSCNVDQA